jgi:hypothetical protein
MRTLKRLFILTLIGFGLVIGLLLSGCATVSAVGGLAQGIGTDIQRAADSYDAVN